MKGWIVIFIVAIFILLLITNFIFIMKMNDTRDELRAWQHENDSLRKFIGRVYQDPQLICDSVLNRDNVYNYIRLKGIRWPNVVWAQSMVETGYLGCKNCCLQYNNLFGFMDGSQCMSFDTWQRSVDYYAKWQNKLLKPNEDYYTFLNRIKYASFREYLIHVQQILIDNKMKYQKD